MINSILVYLPFLISFLIGFLALKLICPSDKPFFSLFNLSLSGLSGLGLSAIITFTSFLFFNQFHQIYIVLTHLFILLGLTYFNLHFIKKWKDYYAEWRNLSLFNFTEIFIFIILLIPCWIQANTYPYGGWDAWSTWNLKAKFLLLSGENWKIIFDPVLWRSSPHYPLLLPLVNVWGWSLINKPNFQVPIFTTFLFTFFTHGLLFTGIKRLLSTPFAILSISALLTIELYTKLSTSQYCDIVIAAFILTTILMLIIGKIENKTGFFILAGVFLGFLSFTKPEGYLASLLISIIAIAHILLRNTSPIKQKQLIIFITCTAVSFIPTILFILFLAPKNATFVNGLTSTANPSTFIRLQFIFAFYLFKLISTKWSFLWIALLIGLGLSIKKSFNTKALIIPLFLISYIAITTAYYYINTEFEIGWWLQVTFDRVFAALLPLIIFWIFYSVGQLKKSNAQN